MTTASWTYDEYVERKQRQLRTKAQQSTWFVYKRRNLRAALKDSFPDVTSEELDTLIRLTGRRKKEPDYAKLLARIRAFRESGEWKVTTIPSDDPRTIRKQELQDLQYTAKKR
jgi:hypothetical protein